MTATQSRALKLLFATSAAIAMLGAIRYTAANAADETRACNHEHENVQRALSAYMAANNLASVPTSDGTDDMIAPVLLYNRHPTAADPTFIATSRTLWGYGWDSKGTITSSETGSSGHSVPVGCKPDDI